MTMRELYKLRDLNALIEDTAAKIRICENSCASAGLPDGMPRGSSNPHSVVEDAAVELEGLRRELDGYIAERKVLRDFISSVEDYHVRRILKYKFEHGLSWVQVAFKMGGGNTGESVRQAAWRYLKKSEK